MEILLSISSILDNSVREVKRSLDDGLVVGRGAEDGILLEGKDLSREHFVLTQDGTAIFVTDLSVNGTWLNGKRLKPSVRARVHPGDAISISGYVLSYQLVEELDTDGQEAQPLPNLGADAESQTGLAQPQSPRAMLDPVLSFLSSFTLMEKTMFLVAVSGLFLLYAYAAS
jgi:pSer/pThr/pTyr-binding forkhead associated (FHA) protein